MKKFILNSIKEAVFSVLPLSFFAFFLGLFPQVGFGKEMNLLLLFSSIFLILGIALFNMGATLSMGPIGSLIGTKITKSNKVYLLLWIGFLLGILITIAEPDLQVLSSQIKNLFFGGKWFFVFMIGLGVGLMLVCALIKTVFHKDLFVYLMLMYFGTFLLALLVQMKNKGFLFGLAFDSGGVTTGPLTVPFLMALGVSVSRAIGGKNKEEQSFGFIAFSSIGPIAIVLLLSFLSHGNMNYEVPLSYSGFSFSVFWKSVLQTSKEILFPIGLIFLFFLMFDRICLKISWSKWKNIILGGIMTYIGLVLFLVFGNNGFMPIGFYLGKKLSSLGMMAYVLCFIFGSFTVLAEPAVHILAGTVNSITGGVISKRKMFIALCAGVGLAVMLSIIKIHFQIPLMYFLIPGYFICFFLGILVPRLYTAVAFDSGGVASGPLTSCFLLPLAIGYTVSFLGVDSVVEYAFGLVSLVAMAPVIMIQVLGFIALMKKRHAQHVAYKRILDLDDEQIISFEL